MLSVESESVTLPPHRCGPLHRTPMDQTRTHRRLANPTPALTQHYRVVNLTSQLPFFYTTSRSTCGSRCKVKTGKTRVTQDAVDVQRLPINAPGTRCANNDRERACCGTREQRTPPHAPSLFRPLSAPEDEGFLSAQAFAKCLMNAIVSSDQRPATSPASTTNLALCPGWTKSG